MTSLSMYGLDINTKLTGYKTMNKTGEDDLYNKYGMHGGTKGAIITLSA